MATQMVAKPIPVSHIGAAREPNVARPPCASYVPTTPMPSRNASAFIGRKTSWDDLARHQLQRRTDHGRSPAGLLTTLVARLFGPAIFEASKLNVLFLGVDEKKHPGNLPRAYTLTHSDITAKLTLAVSQTINKAQLQGWYNRLQRDEVVAEWKKAQGKMSLHVHCHISGGHWLLDAIAHLRFYIFRKELPVVLEAFRHGDEALFNKHPELEEALVWVYFHSNVKEFSRVECWGPLRDAAKGDAGQAQSAREAIHNAWEEMGRQRPERCPEPCSCCYPPFSLIPWPGDCEDDHLRTQE